MKTIEIKTQDEFDKLPDSFEDYTEIKITGNLEKANREFINGYIAVSGSAVIKSVSGFAVIQSVSDSAVIQSVSDSAVIKLIYGNAKAILKSDGCKVLKSLHQSIIICQDCKPEINSKSNIPVIYTQKVKYNIESFFDIYGNGTDTITLYKSVNHETRCDFHTGKIKYDGIVKCNDFDSDPKRECGGGLHLSPLPQLALNYNNGLLLKCEVKKSDIVVYYDNISKVRCREVKVIGECDIDGNLIKGGKK